jgi:hypothetical protein
MRTFRKSTICTFALASFALLGCPSDDSEADGDDDDSTGADDDSTMTDPSNTMTDPSMTDPTETETSPDTTAEGPDTTAEGGSSSTTEDQTIFHFNETPPEEYVRVDRKGFPAVNTGLHIHGDKDEYNQNYPQSDLGAYFDMSAMEAIESLNLLHFGPDEDVDDPPSGLDDELQGLGFVTCDPFPLGPGTCVDQGGGGAVYPDTLKIDLDLQAGFHFDETTCNPVPNGRGLADPVIDIIFSVILLDLSQPPPDGFGVPCPGDPDSMAPGSGFLAIPDGEGGTFSLNPAANDVAFDTAFPYVAPAHAP